MTAPPLRARRDDIPLLVDHFLGKYCKKNGRTRLVAPPEVTAILTEYPWPGNVRELENVIERAVVLCRSARLEVSDLPDTLREAPVTEASTVTFMLYFEKRLSKNHDVSCASCHDLAKYGVDGEQFSTGHKKQKGGRNAPTVYNAGVHLAQFWDGRAADARRAGQGPRAEPRRDGHGRRCRSREGAQVDSRLRAAVREGLRR